MLHVSLHRLASYFCVLLVVRSQIQSAAAQKATLATLDHSSRSLLRKSDGHHLWYHKDASATKKTIYDGAAERTYALKSFIHPESSSTK